MRVAPAFEGEEDLPLPRTGIEDVEVIETGAVFQPDALLPPEQQPRPVHRGGVPALAQDHGLAREVPEGEDAAPGQPVPHGHGAAHGVFPQRPEAAARKPRARAAGRHEDVVLLPQFADFGEDALAAVIKGHELERLLRGGVHGLEEVDERQSRIEEGGSHAQGALPGPGTRAVEHFPRQP